MNMPLEVIERRAQYLSLLGWGLLLCLYALVFRLFSEQTLLPSFQRALINVVPAVLLTFPILYLIQTFVFGTSLLRQIIIHSILVLVFSFAWLIGIQVGYGLKSGWLSNGISGRPLLGVALTWQAFQGVLIYVIIALYGYAKHFFLALAETKAELEYLRATTSDPKKASAQIIVKDGNNLIPVRIEDILLLSGAGDYSEVVTTSGRYLSNSRLGEFSETLPQEEFQRIHRSHIVRLDAITSFENAGNGRLSLFLPKGLSVVTSREGAKAIKSRSL